MIGRPLTIIGNTVAIVAATVAPAPVRVTSSAGAYCAAQSYMIVNTGAQTAYFASDLTAADAMTKVAVPGSALVWTVLPGQAIVIAAEANAYWTAITATLTSACTVTPVGS